MDKSIVFPVAAGAAFAALCGWFLTSVSVAPAPAAGKYEPAALEKFAACLAEKGAKMYGASWCPHCQAQKADFGAAARVLPYVECGMGPRAQDGQAPACAAVRIVGYPTWVFADGTRLEGEKSFAVLAAQAGCAAPAELAAAPGLTGSAAQR